MNNVNFEKTGYTVAVLAVTLVVLWNGILKFTPTEAAGIEHYIINSPFMSWMYKVGSLQQVSNFLGMIEIPASILMIVHLFWKKEAGIIAGFLLSMTFLTTLSFLFTTPGMLKSLDGIPATNFSLLKDMMGLGISIMVFGNGLEAYKKCMAKKARHITNPPGKV